MDPDLQEAARRIYAAQTENRRAVVVAHAWHKLVEPMPMGATVAVWIFFPTEKLVAERLTHES